MEAENRITWKDIIFLLVLALLFVLMNLEHLGKYIGY